MTKRKLFVTLVCGLISLCLVLTGCGGTKTGASTGNDSAAADSVKSDADAPAPSAPLENATITHYTVGNQDKTWLKDIMPDFMKAHPNIKMEFLAVPYDNFDAKLTTMVAGGNPPDVTTHYGNTGFIEFLSKDMILDLNPIMQKANYVPSEAGIPDNLTNIYKINDKIYGIPVSAYVSAVFYNKDIFDKANVPYPTSDYEDKSWTFDAMVELAKKVTSGTGALENKTFGLVFDVWGDWDIRPVYFGAKVYSDDTWTNGGYPSENYFGSPECIKATQRLIDLVYEDKVAPTQAEVKALSAGGDVFTSGKLAMYTTGAWALSYAKDVPFKIGVAAVPYGGNEKARDVIYVDPLMIMKGSKAPDAAFEWIKYLTSKEVQEIALEKAFNPPANALALEKYFSSVEGVDPKDMKNVYEGGLKYGIETTAHLVTCASQVIPIIQNELSQNYNQGGKVDEACKKAQEAINDVLKQNTK